jgi:hypothetical protein
MKKGTMSDASRFKQKRGVGRGVEYLPWLRVIDVKSSMSRSHRPFCFKTLRQHELMSDLELYFFLLMVWDDSVIDIREQFPLLPMIKTQHIASKMGYRHPMPPGTNMPIVMTTDFVITRKVNGILIDEAIAIKSSNDLDKVRTREKMAIERQFWIEQEISWKVVTEKDMAISKAKNLKRLFNINQNIEIRKMSQILMSDFLDAIKNIYIKEPEMEHDLIFICSQFDNYNELTPGTGIKVLMHNIWKKNIVIDLNVIIKFKKTKIERMVFKDVKLLVGE